MFHTLSMPEPAGAQPLAAEVALRGLACVQGPFRLAQKDVIARARELLGGRYAVFDRLAPAFENAGIEARGSVVPIEWFGPDLTWKARNDAYLEGAARLYATAARAALDRAGLTGREVDAVVTVSSTGVATPTLEALTHRQLGFRDDLLRVPVFGLGCAGGVSGLAIARDLAAAVPGRVVLMVAVEACTTGFRMDRLTKADVIATALFGDGAAAAVLGPPAGDAPRLGRGAQHMWPDTLRIMGWDVDDLGLGVVFDQSIPAFAAAELAGGVERVLAQLDIRRAEVDRFVCHPGGAKVVVAIEEALDLAAGSLNAEREVLRRNGNMSAPTALFVLEALLNAGQLPPRSVMLALGPGFTLSALEVRR